MSITVYEYNQDGIYRTGDYIAVSNPDNWTTGDTIQIFKILDIASEDTFQKLQKMTVRTSSTGCNVRMDGIVSPEGVDYVRGAGIMRMVPIEAKFSYYIGDIIILNSGATLCQCTQGGTIELVDETAQQTLLEQGKLGTSLWNSISTGNRISVLKEYPERYNTDWLYLIGGNNLADQYDVFYFSASGIDVCIADDLTHAGVNDFVPDKIYHNSIGKCLNDVQYIGTMSDAYVRVPATLMTKDGAAEVPTLPDPYKNLVSGQPFFGYAWNWQANTEYAINSYIVYKSDIYINRAVENKVSGRLPIINPPIGSVFSYNNDIQLEHVGIYTAFKPSSTKEIEDFAVGDLVCFNQTSDRHNEQRRVVAQCISAGKAYYDCDYFQTNFVTYDEFSMRFYRDDARIYRQIDGMPATFKVVSERGCFITDKEFGAQYGDLALHIYEDNGKTAKVRAYKVRPITTPNTSPIVDDKTSNATNGKLSLIKLGNTSSLNTWQIKDPDGSQASKVVIPLTHDGYVAVDAQLKPLHVIPQNKPTELKLVHCYDSETHRYTEDLVLDWTDRDPVTAKWMLPINSSDEELPIRVWGDEKIYFHNGKFVIDDTVETEKDIKDVERNNTETLAMTVKAKDGVESLVVPGGEIWIS